MIANDKVRVMVTGGAGFIGSHLAKRLLDAGCDVVVFDDLSVGEKKNVPTGANLIKGSVTSCIQLRSALKDVDYVFHLAALTSVQASMKNPLMAEEINGVGTVNALMESAKAGVKKFIMASSCSVYGNAIAQVQAEETPISPRSPYALSKVVGELYCKHFAEARGLPTVALRFFNVYGYANSSSSYSLVIPTFIRNAKIDLPLTIFGDGSQTRDYVHVDDVVDANMLALDDSMKGVYNVGTGIGTSVNTLITYIRASEIGHGVRVVCAKPRPGDPLHACADISRISRIGWFPRHVLADDIRVMCNALRD